MVAYYYPPRGGGGTQRTVKYAKYLPHFGFKPVILTSAEPAQKNIDASLAQGTSEKVPVVKVHGHEFSGKWRRLADGMLFPDALRLWARPAISMGVLAAKQFGVQAIYSTASPYTDHIVGRAIARKTGLPWIADFRDLWTSNALYEPRAPLQRYFHRRLERSFYQDADAIIAASPWQRRAIITEFRISEYKVFTITNGFDPDDFADTAPPATASLKGVAASNESLTIGYLGSFYGKYRPADLIEALKIVQRDRPALAQILRLEFIGDFDRASRALLSDPG